MSHPSQDSPPMQRRSFLKWMIHGMGALFAIVLGVPAIAFLVDARNRPARSSGFRTVARLSDLQVGVPKQAAILDVRRDAWTLHGNDVLGRVWLIRRDNDKVDTFTTTCPHLGCSINWEERATRFLCPCHGGTFEVSGQRVERAGLVNPAPRGMDALENQLIRDPASPNDKPDFLVQVKYQNFIQGRHEKLPKA
jgi:menaquinol-cytochrome c reductase iron-sulfur subunit